MRKFIPLLLFIISVAGAYAQSWKTYPYHEEGTVLYFPQDEGRHPDEPTEWWYANSFLTGQQTGKEYSMMISYFYYPALGFDGFRIFNLTDESEGQFFTDALPCVYPVMSEDRMHIQASTWGGGQEQWVTKTDDSGELIPFEYHLEAQSSFGSINLDFVALKRPLMIGETGFVYQGAFAYSYYYSLTRLEVSGSITLNGLTEPVSGIAWLDRQYGTFNPSIVENYEWFSLQLSNGMDLNVWELFNDSNVIPDTATYRHFSVFINDSVSVSDSEFTLQRLQYAFTPETEHCYAKQWRFTHDTIDLTFTSRYSDQEVILPFEFYEGSVDVSGTVGTETVTGQGFAELLHRYDHPAVRITNPAVTYGEGGLYPIAWQLLNPDDGRPVWYDVEVSTGNDLNFEPIAVHLSDTVFFWDNSAFDPGTPFWVKVKAYSNDSTLTGNDSTTQAVYTAVKNLNPASRIISAFPNPAGERTMLESSRLLTNAKLQIINGLGETVQEITAINGTSVLIERKGLAPGIYFYRLSSAEGIMAKGKLIFR